jgi:hypothetical protein
VNLTEKINKILQLDPDARTPRTGKGHTKQLHNPYGRTERLTETLTIRVLSAFKEVLLRLPHWSEVVRVVLESELDSGNFFLRQPVRHKPGRGSTASTTNAQIVVRVSPEFKERITSVSRWQARSREALYDALDQWLVPPEVPSE